MQWILIVPMIPPSSGGAATYTKILSREILHHDNSVVIITEATPGYQDHLSYENLRVIELFPFRSGRPKKDWLSYLYYMVQIFSYALIPPMLMKLCRARETNIIVHSSFLYFPGPFSLVMRLTRALLPKTSVIMADVRDTISTSHAIRSYSLFDGVFFTSKDVEHRTLEKNPEIRASRMIPIPFDLRSSSCSDVHDSHLLEQYKLLGCRYIFNPGGISEIKDFPLIKRLFIELTKCTEYSDVLLVTAGRNRSPHLRDYQLEASGRHRFLGPVPQDVVAILGKHALASVVLNKNEAPSRSALEIISSGGRILLPPISDFSEKFPEYCASSSDVTILCEKLRFVIEAQPITDYDFSAHSASGIFEVLSEFCNSARNNRSGRAR